MRFRRLNQEELGGLAKEFINFLAVAGVEAHDWEDFKTSNPKFCEEKIEEFSDVVLGSILEKANYAEFKSASDWMLFKFASEKIDLILLRLKPEVDESMSELSFNEEILNKVDVFKQSKAYSKEKVDELFDMTQNGCEISDGVYYEKLKDIIG